MFNPILFRHHLHKMPELSGNEKETQKVIADTLRTFGYAPLEGIGGHGVIVKIESDQAGPQLLFRADMDALPINERANHEHGSQRFGVMHACGHDGHSASLMGLAHRLSEQNLQRGSVTLLFQPSEENGEGARSMLADDKWSQGHIDYAFGYHNVPGFPLGQILCRDNTFSCASTGVSVKFTGTTAHAAYPETAINPSRAIRQLMIDIEGFPSTIKNGLTMSTIVHINLGKPAFGTTPESGELMATLRSDSNKSFASLCDHVKERAQYYADRDGLTLDINWVDSFSATINHSEANMLLKQACKDLGFDFVNLEEPMRWSEDFSEYSKAWPSAFFGIGSGAEHPPLHDPHYDFPDTLIDISSKLFEQIIKDMNGLRT
ncbi:amidohydrolase [Enterovibrio makurazakiensis]|uniref:amidohydrolase n=1 Tax=Enterovibrio makurazakiensis TaxID=2910232 RepID=UPI003D1DCF49